MRLDDETTVTKKITNIDQTPAIVKALYPALPMPSRDITQNKYCQVLVKWFLSAPCPQPDWPLSSNQRIKANQIQNSQLFVYSLRRHGVEKYKL